MLGKMCFANGLFDAAELCLLFDVVLIVSTIYYLNTEDHIDPSQGRFYNSQIVSASIGLPAGALLKYLYTHRQAVVFGFLFAFCATLSYCYTTFVEFMDFLSVRQQAEFGTVSIPNPFWFWTFQVLNFIVMIIVAINHGQLASFAFARAQREASDLRAMGGGVGDVL